MKKEDYQWLAAIIAAHQGHRLTGRTRLQKTTYLLQRLGLPTGYPFHLYYYGPYSEAIQTDIRRLEQFDLLDEHPQVSKDGSTYYSFEAKGLALGWGRNPALEQLLPQLQEIQRHDPVVLELAATYDALRESGMSKAQAKARLRLMKDEKCTPRNEDEAVGLLTTLGLEK